MAWSKSQCIFIHRATKAAGWNADQRYIAMRHAGCPCVSKGANGTMRPSVNTMGNTQHQFELVMSIAEGHWRMNGTPGEFPASRSGESWERLASRNNSQTLYKVREIWAEARERLPETFAPHGLDGFVQRMTKNHDDLLAFQAKPMTIDDVRDPATLYRIVEGLKGWVGREFCTRGMKPRSFALPRYLTKRSESGAA